MRDEISRNTRQTLEKLQEEATEKIRLRTERRLSELRMEKLRNRRHNLEKVQKEEKEKIRFRTKTRLAELGVEHLREEEEEDRLLPS